MLSISNAIVLAKCEIELTGILAKGSGGQKVNKTSSAIHLRFEIKSSKLPPFYKERLLKLTDSRITTDGVIIIKAQNYRTQYKNKADALQRLKELILSAVVIHNKRRATIPTWNSQKRRVKTKTIKGKIKMLRGKVFY